MTRLQKCADIAWMLAVNQASTANAHSATDKIVELTVHVMEKSHSKGPLLTEVMGYGGSDEGEGQHARKKESGTPLAFITHEDSSFLSDPHAPLGTLPQEDCANQVKHPKKGTLIRSRNSNTRDMAAVRRANMNGLQ